MTRLVRAWPRLAAWAVAAAVRLGVVAWAAPRFPPTADGTFFHVLASRLAAGLGYTWAWPDGAVTAAAHYPVGYPAFVALGYAAFGPSPAVALGVNALVGALVAPATFELVRGGDPTRARRAGLAALAVALHPALVPYVAAVMTESVGVALVAVAAACVARARQVPPAAPARARFGPVAAAGLALGLAVLVRPQVLLLAPIFGALAAPSALPALRRAALVTGLSLAVCAPWTARNCVTMKQCALVSVNGGWNLLIGSQTPNGSYVPMEAPEACLTVWDEAAKDACFGREARAAIASEPGAFLAKVPSKLAVTFDYFGAAPWYLHAANPAAFPASAKVTLAAVETVAARVGLVLALLAAGQLPGGAARGRKVTSFLLVAVAFSEHAWPAYLGLAALLAFRRGVRAEPPLAALSAAVIAQTALVHAVFFGGGRYGLGVVPFVVAVAALVPWTRLPARAAGGRSADAGAAQAVAGLVSGREESPSSEGHDAG